MKGKIYQQTHVCSRALCAMRTQGSGSGMLRMKLGWYSQSFGLGNHPIHTGMHVHTHTHTHTYLPSGIEFLFCSLSPPTRRARSNGSCRNSILFADVFFSQKSWSLISVLSKPTTQHHYSDFLLLPTNLPFIHCLKKKTKTICSFPNPHTAYPNASFSSTSDSLLWLPSSLLVTSFHPVHLPQSNCYGPSLMWYWKVNVPVRTFSTMK